MAKSKASASNISEAVKSFRNQKFLPVYYFFGQDSFSIDAALKTAEESIQPLIFSDFDKEVFYGEDRNLNDILTFCSSFPFGGGKKLIIFKEFEKVKDKKALTSYLSSPAEFTILIIVHNGSLSSSDSEPFKSLSNNGFLFEAKELKGNTLIEWLVSYAESKQIILTRENAQLLTDISGENRSMLEAQIEKMITFLGDEERTEQRGREITLNMIKSLSTSLKEYTIFDLQNAIAKKNKAAALRVAYNMLDKGNDIIFILTMLTRYFTGLSRITEMKEKNVPDQAAARIVGSHPYYFKEYQDARKIFSDKNLANAARALLNADLSVKSTSVDEKTIISMLIAELISE